MLKDPIVAATRALRDEYAHQFNYDAGAMYEDLMNKQAMHPERVVSLPPRKVRCLESVNGKPHASTALPSRSGGN